MAIAHAMSLAERTADNGTGTKYPWGIEDAANVNIGGPVTNGFILMLFTPLLTAGKGMELLAFGTDVWG